MLRLFGLLTGFGFSIIGFVYIIAYLNYLTVGYTFLDYIKIVFTKGECLLAFLGLIIIAVLIFMKGNKNDLCI